MFGGKHDLVKCVCMCIFFLWLLTLFCILYLDYDGAPAVITCNAAFSLKVNVLMLLCGCNYWQENPQLIL